MRSIKIFITSLVTILSIPLFALNIKGKVMDNKGAPLISATVMIKESGTGTVTDSEGYFELPNMPDKSATIIANFIGHEPYVQKIDSSYNSKGELQIRLQANTHLKDVEVFGERYKQPEKLDVITRMPLRPSEQIQSISIISEKAIAEQGVLTVTDAVRNVPGVTLFGSYGGVRESLSSRGYRGVPVVKNGVRLDSDFRTASALTEMQGVESVQVIKGSAAITQGIGNDLGSPGGVVNVVTKTPKFISAGEVSLRGGNWGYFRPTFDVQSVLSREKNIAFRLNGAFERSDNYRPVINSSRVYINPSLEWRPDEKTIVTLEMDYLNDNRTPYTSSVNLAADSVDALYKMPYSKFFGFKTDNTNNITTTRAIRVNRKISDKYSLRVSYFASSYKVDNTSTALASILNVYPGEYNMRKRTVSRSLRDDNNEVFQLDFVGRDVYTGLVKHTFQIGFDYKYTDLSTTSYGSAVIDTIDVLQENIPNTITKTVSMSAASPVESQSSSYGIMAQEVMTINKYLKAILGLRYSYGLSVAATSVGPTKGDVWNPMVGAMISPVKNINLFGSYTTTTSLRSAANRMSNGEEIGPSTTKQLEVGVKSDWLNNRLRFNFTYFDIITENLSNTEYVEGTNTSTGYYIKAGDLLRNGIEVELNGRILPELQVMLGYAYLNAHYENSPSYVNGSSPMNAPDHTANAWVYYTFEKSALKGLSAGLGTYYVGERPVNEYSLSPDGHGTPAGVKPFEMPAYTTVNLQLAYNIHRVTVRVFANNIFDAIGYNAYYRGGYINQIDPKNFAAVVSYKF
ncbi:MAG: TonB-dependent receptor [Paludibacter sp.]|nr:TonB-dependent receptor [Paludibacter sp.]